MKTLLTKQHIVDKGFEHTGNNERGLNIYNNSTIGIGIVWDGRQTFSYKDRSGKKIQIECVEDFERICEENAIKNQTAL